MEYYYYTRWTFKQTPDGLDNCGPYHLMTISIHPPNEFMKDQQWDKIKDFFYVSLQSRDEMENYYLSHPHCLSMGSLYGFSDRCFST